MKKLLLTICLFTGLSANAYGVNPYDTTIYNDALIMGSNGSLLEIVDDTIYDYTRGEVYFIW